MTAPGEGDPLVRPRALRAEFDRRTAEIRAMTDKEQAARAALKLVTESGEFTTEAGQLRTETFENLRAENLTLQQIADLLGLKLPTVQKVLEREKRASRERARKAAQKRRTSPPGT